MVKITPCNRRQLSHIVQFWVKITNEFKKKYTLFTVKITWHEYHNMDDFYNVLDHDFHDDYVFFSSKSEYWRDTNIEISTIFMTSLSWSWSWFYDHDHDHHDYVMTFLIFGLPLSVVKLSARSRGPYIIINISTVFVIKFVGFWRFYFLVKNEQKCPGIHNVFEICVWGGHLWPLCENLK